MEERRDLGRVTEEDKRRMRRLAEDLKELETDEPVRGEALTRVIMWANDQREKLGVPPLETTDDEYPPELEFYRKGRALGMGKRRR